MRLSLEAQPITVGNLPRGHQGELDHAPTAAPASRRMPKGDPNDNEMLRQFARAVLAVEPRASGGPISILESGHTIVRAFFEAGAWAFMSIAILLWIVLRRFTDVC